MAEEVGIVMSLYDRISPTLKTISGNTGAFDKSLDELSQGIQQYDKVQDGLLKDLSALKKAMEESNQKVIAARKEYKKLNDEASKGALDEAIDEQVRLKRQLTETESAVRTQSRLYEDLYDKARKAARGVKEVSTETDKVENQADSVRSGSLLPADGGGVGSLLSSLGKAGIYDMAGDVGSQLVDVFGESIFGQPTASLVSSALSGTAQGAAIGSMVLPGMGTAIGAGAGALAGLFSGGSQIYAAKDDAFKSYVQESVEGQLEEMDTVRTSGSATAGQREQDQMAFAQRFGSDEAAQDYLDQAKAMAVNTNYTYDEITGYSKSLLNSYSPEETFGVLQKLSDATAGLNLDSGGVSMFIAGLSRMRTTNKATQEYLNYFSERGLDVYEALARSTGTDKSRIAGMVTDGDISGTEAAQSILDYIQAEFGGLSEKLASTYDAMADNLADAETNLNARMGEGYNEARKAGLSEQQDWLESDRLGEAYEAIGAWKAGLENAKEKCIREAVDHAMDSEDYQAAQAEGDAAEMGRIIMQAKIKGMGEYNANEGKDKVLAQEAALIDGVREDAALNESYWDAGYALGQEYSKGRSAAMQEDSWAAPGDWSYNADLDGGSAGAGHAYGLRRVPYDNYAALLHEGERVLTAREAREQDRGGGAPSITVQVSGNTFGAGLDEEAVAARLADAFWRKVEAGYRG